MTTRVLLAISQAIRDVDEKFRLASIRSSSHTTALAALSVSADKRRPAQRRSDFADAQRAGLTPVLQALGITPARALEALDM